MKNQKVVVRLEDGSEHTFTFDSKKELKAFMKGLSLRGWKAYTKNGVTIERT